MVAVLELEDVAQLLARHGHVRVRRERRLRDDDGAQDHDRPHGDDGAQPRPSAQHPPAVSVDAAFANAAPRLPDRRGAREAQEADAAAGREGAAEGAVGEQEGAGGAAQDHGRRRVAGAPVVGWVALAQRRDELQHREHGGGEHEGKVQGNAYEVSRRAAHVPEALARSRRHVVEAAVVAADVDLGELGGAEGEKDAAQDGD